MSTWLKLLPLELFSIEESDLIEPDCDVEPKDHIVGKMSDDLKRIFTRHQMLCEAADRAVLEAKYARTDNDKRVAFVKATELHAKAEAIKAIFWIAVKDEHNLWDKENVGVRKGSVVVWSEESASLPTFLDFLRGLQGH